MEHLGGSMCKERMRIKSQSRNNFLASFPANVPMGKVRVDLIRPINRLLTLILGDWQRTTESCVPPDSITEPKTPASPLNKPPYHHVQSHFILSNV